MPRATPSANTPVSPFYKNRYEDRLSPQAHTLKKYLSITTSRDRPASLLQRKINARIAASLPEATRKMRSHAAVMQACAKN
jgi:hypothetical protein